MRRILPLLLLLSAASLAPAQSPSPAASAAGDGDSASDKAASHTVTLSDFGAEDLGYLAIPTTQPQVGLVLVPDAYGLDEFTKSEADRLAAQGYLALAVDLYNGHQTTDPDEMANLVANQDTASAMKTVTAGIRLFHESPKFRVSRVIVIGWGNGARYTFQEARDNKGIDGAVMLYGPVETNVEKIGKFAAPICAVYPENDPVASRENVQVFERMMKDSGNDFSAWFIAAGAGWSEPSSKNYSAVEDKEAWKVIMPFLVRIGAEPVKVVKPSIIDQAKAKLKGLFQ